MELHKARQNKEVDDLISTLRCGAGKTIDLDKAKFDKLIALADADDDGKHIELLLMTLMHEHLRPMIEAGKVYIALSPLYKVSITGQATQYINTTADLSKFFASQIGQHYTFINSDNEAEIKSAKAKAKYVAALLKYRKELVAYADELSISPHILETVFVSNLDEGDLELGDRIEINELPNGNYSFVGFYVNDADEHFVSCTTGDDILERLEELQNLLFNTLDITLIDKHCKSVVTSSMFNAIETVFQTVKRNARVSRLKGLGEINPDELWETSLNPETRRLVRVNLIEDSESVISSFMGKNPDERKEFLKDVFAEVIAEAEEV